MAEERLHDAGEQNYTPRKGGIRFPFSTERRTSSPTMPKETPLHTTQTQTPQEALVVETADKPKRTKRNKVLKIAATGFGGALLVGATALGVEHYVLEDNTSSANSQTTQSLGSVPGGTSFSNEGPQLEGLLPHLQSPSKESTIEPTTERTTEAEQPNPDEKVNPEEVFDNEAKEVSFNKKNTHFVSPEQAREFNLASVKIDIDGQKITFPLPFKLPEGTTGTIKRINLAETNPTVKDPSILPQVQPVNVQFDNIATIFAPDDNTHIYVIRGVEEFGQNPDYAGSIRIYKYYKEENTTIVWSFYDGDRTKKGYLVPLLPMQDFDKNIGRGTNYEKLPVGDTATEAARVESNQTINFTVEAYRGKIAGPDAEIAGDDFLLKPQFKTDEKGQLIVIASED